MSNAPIRDVPSPAAASTEPLTIRPWVDPLVDRLGHDPRSRYVEQFWLGVLGPSTTLFLRLCAHAFDREPDGAELEVGDIAHQLGLGHKGGRNSPMARSILRCCRFGMARPSGSGVLEVRRRLAPLNRGQIDRLSPQLQVAHAAHLEYPGPKGSADEQRARQVALSLIECGDGVDMAEVQLGQWRFTPAVAASAVQWAWNQHENQRSQGPSAA